MMYFAPVKYREKQVQLGVFEMDNIWSEFIQKQGNLDREDSQNPVMFVKNVG